MEAPAPATAGWWSPSPCASPTASPPPPPRTPHALHSRCRCPPLYTSTSYNCLPHYDGWFEGEDEIGGGAFGGDSVGGALREGELRALHRAVPALRRRHLDTRPIKHHFYPEGGWGWIVCGAAFLAHLLSTGLQLAYGALHGYALRHLGPGADHAVWAGAMCVGVSRCAGAAVAARRGSPRLAAAAGGLLLPLACLFTSFATQLHQALLSYGIVLGVGCGMVREPAGLMLGTYFRRRRQFVELVAHAGAGVGITLFSVAYKEALGKLGWRLGLQAITGVLVLAFFLSAVYRNASLYHPQRRAILHLKNQRRKVKEKKSLRQPAYIDLSGLNCRPAKILFLAAGFTAFGLYTPVFFLALQGLEEGLEESALVLIQTFLGFAVVLGSVISGLILLRPSAQCLVSKQYLCQTTMMGIGASMLALSTVEGYHGYVLFTWIYGLCLGGYMYCLKMLVMERVRAKHFPKVWGFVQGAEAIPVMVGVPVTGYINQQVPRAGFYLSTAAILVGALLLFFVGYSKRETESPGAPTPAVSGICPCGSPPRHEPAWCACSAGGATAYCAWPGPTCSSRLPRSLSYAAPLDRSCCSAPPCPECYRRHTTLPLRTSRSVPEGLARTSSRADSYRPHRKREHHVIEQMTTSV